MHVLLVEDDLTLSKHLAEALVEEGMTIDVIHNAKNIAARITSNKTTVDAIILNRLLGDYDAKYSIVDLRTNFPSTAIVVLSSVDTPHERIELLNLGADDYIGKPFDTREFIARLKAIGRRTKKSSQPFTQIGNLQLDVANRKVTVGNESLPLSSKEFAMLRALSKEEKKVWSKADLLLEIWSNNEDPNTNVVEMTVANLRKKLASIGASATIKNMRFVGYWLEA